MALRLTQDAKASKAYILRPSIPRPSGLIRNIGPWVQQAAAFDPERRFICSILSGFWVSMGSREVESASVDSGEHFWVLAACWKYLCNQISGQIHKVEPFNSVSYMLLGFIRSLLLDPCFGLPRGLGGWAAKPFMYLCIDTWTSGAFLMCLCSWVA